MKTTGNLESDVDITKIIMNQFFYLITALTDFHYFNFVNKIN